MSYGEDPTRHTVWLPHTFDMDEDAQTVWNALENAGYLDDDDDTEVRDAFGKLMMTLYVQSGYSGDSHDPYA